MKEITLPLFAELATRKLIGREGGTPELPEALVMGDQVTCQLRLMERRNGELRERVPVVRTLRASLGKTLEPPTGGTFELVLDPGSPAVIEIDTSVEASLATASRILVFDGNGGTLKDAQPPGPFATMEESLAALRALDADEEFYAISEIVGGVFTVTVTAPGEHSIQLEFIDLDEATVPFLDDGFNGARTGAIAFDSSAAAVLAALNDSRVAGVESPTAGTWVVKTTFADSGEGWTPSLFANALTPHSFVRIRPFTLAGFHWFELRLVQAPLAFTGLHERVLPEAPSVRRIQGGGSGSSSDDIEVNEIQALKVPEEFRGSYVLGFDLRQTDLLGVDDGTEEIAAALNAMWPDGLTRFAATNPEAEHAYIEFIGPFADTGFDLITATVKSHPPGVLTFTLNLRTAELAAALRTVAEITVPFELELEVLPDGTDPEDEEVAGKIITIQHSFKVRREQIWEELAVVPAIDWIRPPQPKRYIPFSPNQVITGQQHYVTTIGDGVSAVLPVDHGLATSDIAGVTVIHNASGAALTKGVDYDWTVTSDNDLEIEALDGIPETDSWGIVITTAGPRSAFAAHTHAIAEIDGLQELLDLLAGRLTAIEDLLPTVSPTTPDSPFGTVQTIPIPPKSEVFPGRFAPGFNPETALRDATVLPRPPGLLPAILAASTIALIEDDPLPIASETEGAVFLNDTGAELLIPGGLGRRSAKVPNEGFFGSDGRVLYRLSRSFLTSWYFPTDFERELFTIHINSNQLRAGLSFSVNFDLELALIKATTKAQMVLVIEVGVAPSEPLSATENLAGIDWDPEPLLEQRIVLSEVPMTHRFGAAVHRSAAGAVSASRLRYGVWEGGAQAPEDASFILRARLIDFDTENSAVNERGFVFFALNNASAAIQ